MKFPSLVGRDDGVVRGRERGPRVALLLRESICGLIGTGDGAQFIAVFVQ